MAFNFYYAPRVAVGEEPNARDMAGLSIAANIKDESGLGDFHYRLSDYCINWARQIRNSDEFGNMPSQAEYWELYALLDPIKNDVGTFPVTGPGEPEGANVTSPPGAFIHGVETIAYDNEEGRLGAVNLWYRFTGPAETLEEWWELAKEQRGVIDPATGAQNVPAIEAARSAQNIAWSVRMPHAKTTGGFFPTPNQLLSDCGSDESLGLGIPSYEIKFTALRDDVVVPTTHGSVSVNGDGRSVITYSGTCPYWTEFTASDHVQTIGRNPYYYTVFFAFDDAPDILLREDWLEGPYTGEGTLYRYDADHYSRAVWAFINDFRGTEAQRTPDTFNIEETAFSFQEAYENQWHLAPNIGFNTGLEVAAIYPRARLAADQSIAAGTFLKFGARTQHDYSDGFVFSGCFAKATNLASEVTLEVLSGTRVIARLKLTPGEPMALKYLQAAVTPEPLKVRLAGKAKFSSPGEIIFEANELYSYTPDHWDLYMLLRLSATAGGPEGAGRFLDGSGLDNSAAKQIYQNYARYGCVVNTRAAGIRSQDTAINPNPVYESNRRLLNSLFRMVRRQEMLSYETDSLGRPVLRIKRYAFGLKNEQKADIFAGIAPHYETVPEVIEGVEYIARSHTGGSISYGGRRYTHEKRFIGGSISTYEVNGDALLLEYEGIRATAPKKGWSNEWLMSEEFHFEHPSASSLWKEDAYANWYVRGNRCGTYANFMPSNLSSLADLPVYPGTDPTFRNLHLSPEFPSGWTYYDLFNSGASDDFCKSCQIYRAPYKLASATVEFSATGDDVVRLVFAEPFQRDASAPTSINRDPLTWSAGEVSDLRAEPYRTTDNGLREYFYYLATGTHGSWKVGDAAFNQNGGIAGMQSLPDNPFGAIFPRLFLTSECKIPNLDGNSSRTANDTRISIEEFTKLEIKLKAWCEGAVDGETSVDHVCGGGSFPYDFTYENLKLKAFGGANIGRGHGPATNTHLDAETFNQIAACLDELYIFRLEGLMQFEARQLDYSTWSDVVPVYGSGGCPVVGPVISAIWEGKPPEPALTSTGAWGVSGGFSASANAAIFQCNPESGSAGVLGLQSVKHDVEFRYVTTPGLEFALSPIVQGLIDNNAIGVIGTVTETTTFDRRRATNDFSETSCSGAGDGPGAFWDGSSGYAFDSVTAPEVEQCTILTGGTFSAGNVPSGAFKSCTYAAPTPSGFQEIHGSSDRTAVFTKISDDSSALIVVPMIDVEAAT